MEFEAVIGLEIHAQVATASKLFCGCSTEFGRPPNTNTCPVCLGLPGVLPVTNRRVIELAVRLGLATHCTIRLDSQFARKNYFYPDLPKAYQISQYDRPLCENGWLEIEVEGQTKRIGITRIHLEEDAGKLVHEGRDARASYVDLNRAGVPLVEIVSEPDLSTAEEARTYMEKMHALVTYLEVSRGNMEQGNLRADANVSLRPVGESKLGTRTETKNLNSFRFVREAIDYEIERQTGELRAGGRIVQETRLYDSVRKTTTPMRGKEEANDYRYFPEPDLPVLRLEQAWVDAIGGDLPELPDAKAARYREELGLSAKDAEALTADRGIAEFFEAVLEGGAPPKRAANWIMGDLSARLNEDRIGLDGLKFSPEALAKMLGMIESGDLSGKMGKIVFEEMYATGKAPANIVAEKGLRQVSDAGELETIVARVLEESPEQVEQFRAGKEKVLGYFVGRVMKATGGQANPELVNRILRDKLAS